jgi:hypothetical protein
MRIQFAGTRSFGLWLRVAVEAQLRANKGAIRHTDRRATYVTLLGNNDIVSLPSCSSTLGELTSLIGIDIRVLARKASTSRIIGS